MRTSAAGSTACLRRRSANTWRRDVLINPSFVTGKGSVSLSPFLFCSFAGRSKEQPGWVELCVMSGYVVYESVMKRTSLYPLTLKDFFYG